MAVVAPARCRARRHRASTAAVRPARPRRCAATRAAQAPVPQARVIPAPRSQTRSRRSAAVASICATPILARSGNSGSCSSMGPSAARSTASASSTKNVACGLPMLVQTGVDSGPNARSTCSRCPRRGRAGFAPPGARRAHVDRDLLVRHVFRLRAGRRPSRCDARRLAGLAVQQPGDAAGGVAAGLGLAAVGVADAHQAAAPRGSRGGSSTISWSQPMPVCRSAMRARALGADRDCGRGARRARQSRCRGRASSETAVCS